MIVRRPVDRRSGAAIVEFALLASVFLMFLFGVLEYSRYLLMLHVMNNAARDGARYASVNVSQPANFDYVDATVGTVTYPSVWKYTLRRTGGVDGMITNCQISTFPCDPIQLYQNPPVVTWKAGYVAPTIAQYQSGSAITRTVSWNQASFGERIAVRVSGTYNPVLPSFLFMQGTANVDIRVPVTSEG